MWKLYPIGLATPMYLLYGKWKNGVNSWGPFGSGTKKGIDAV